MPTFGAGLASVAPNGSSYARRRPGKAALLEDRLRVDRGCYGSADEADTPEAMVAPARQDEMSARKSSAGFDEREAAMRSRDATPLLGSTADPGRSEEHTSELQSQR